MAKTPAAEKARRLIALLGVLGSSERHSLEDLALRTGTAPDELADDLVTLSMCGLAPYDPWVLVPVMVDGDTVETFGEIPALRGPVRLSAAEANALAAALQAAGLAADDPLVTELLASSASAFDAAELERVVRAGGTADSNIFEHVTSALQEHLVLGIEYAKPDEPDTTERLIEPLSLFAERGVWYTIAWCRSAGAIRTFRLDRIRSARSTAEKFPPRSDASLAQPIAFDPAGLPSARLRFTDAADFVEREWPGARLVSAEDGGALVEVPFGGHAWIARRVVARSGGVEVLGPEELRASVAALSREIASAL